jgi:beta-glucosidase
MTDIRRVNSLTRAEKELIALGRMGEVDGVPAFVYRDGPNGVRGAEGATVFPSMLALAASFDLSLAREYGEALGNEVIASGGNVLLGPTADVLRVPWAGRSAESFGEDPLLAGEMAGSIVAGVQSRHVIAAVKHFVANNFERLRTGAGAFHLRTDGIDVQVDERSLREIYLEPFRRVIQKYGAAGLLTSYNRLNGAYVSQNHEMLDLPRREWGFAGVTVPDFLFGVRDTAAALNAGLDIPGLDGPSGRTEQQVAALDADALDAIVEHIIAAAAAVGLETPAAPAAPVESLQLAQRIAEQGAVLLSNDGTLPLQQGSRVALLAPADLDHLIEMGGSAAVSITRDRLIDAATALRDVGYEVEFIDPLCGDVPLPSLHHAATATIRDTATGEIVSVQLSELELYETPESIGPEWTAELSFDFAPSAPGLYRLSLDFAGDARWQVGSDTLEGYREASPMIGGPRYPMQTLVEYSGTPVPVQVHYSTGSALAEPSLGFRPGFAIGWAEVGAAIDGAVEAATRADAVIVIAGRASGEAMDLESLHLPAPQEHLIDRVAGVTDRLVVVTAGAGPIVMPWHERVAAILHVWHAGEELAPALAALVSGAAEPGGRLPMTFPTAESDVPLSTRGYPGVAAVSTYDEGVEVGYRAYEARGVVPAYPFGHGLGYTTFECVGASLATTADTISVSVNVANTGPRAGTFVAQLFIASPDGDSPRALRGFASARILAGEDVEVKIAVSIADLRRYDIQSSGWVLDRGEYRCDVGISSVATIWSSELEL